MKPEKNINDDGVVRYILDGKFHRKDGPAMIDARNNKYWFLHGKRHREDGPAFERCDGPNEWCLNDKFVNPTLKNFSFEVLLNKITQIKNKKDIFYKTISSIDL